jgi:ATP-dependent RNA helicase DDX56/DBP9
MKRKLDEQNVPMPVSVDGSHKQYDRSAFSSLELDSRLLQAVLKEQYSRPTPVQSKAIPLALEGKDILGRIAPIYALLL